MNHEQKEQLRKEKIELLDSEILELEKEIKYIKEIHAAEILRMENKLEKLKFQKDIFKKSKIE